MHSLFRRHTLTIELDSSPRSTSPKSRALVFGLPRSASLLVLGGVPGLERVERDEPNVVELRPTGKGKLPRGATIKVSTVGGSPVLVKRVYVEEKGTIEVIASSRPEERKVDPASPSGPKEFLKNLREALYEEEPPTSINRYRRFFYDLNRRTEVVLLQAMANSGEVSGASPSKVEIKRVLNALPFVRRALSVRATRRMREYQATPHICTPFPDPLSFRSYVKVISDLFLRCLHQHFPTRDGGLDFEAFEEAFEMFSTGELRFWLQNEAMPTCHPNSGAFFLFGEFALLAAECDLEADLWTRLANVMVRSQVLYCRTYALPLLRTARKEGEGAGELLHRKPQHCLADYQGSNFQPDRRPVASERRALREAYRGFGLRELSQAAIRNLAEYAPREFDYLPR